MYLTYLFKGVVHVNGSKFDLTLLWVLVVLVFLEGLLAADNAIVMAVMVKHLPPEQRKKALFYGLLGAFVFRFLALFLISIIANFWFIQAAGAVYLIYMSIKNLWQFFKHQKLKVLKLEMIIIMMNLVKRLKQVTNHSGELC